MTFRLSDLRGASSVRSAYPEAGPENRAKAESLLLQAIGTLHPAPLTEAQRQGMAEALAAQMTATAVLRRFALGNADAPAFVRIPAGISDDA